MTVQTLLWMLGASIAFTLMAVAGRELSAELDTFEIMLYRSAAGLLVLAPWIWVAGGRAIATRQPTRHISRSIVHFAAQNLWFYGIITISLAQLVALEFTNPLWVALLAPFLLGETMTARRLAAVGLGFIGILLITRPGFAEFGVGHWAGLGAALGFALVNMMTRDLSREDGVLCILFWMTLWQLILGILTAWPNGIAVPSLAFWPWVLGIGAAGIVAHLCLTSALTLAPASIIAPLEYLRLPIAAVIGTLAYGEPLEIAVLLGAAIIVGGNVFNLTDSRAGSSPGAIVLGGRESAKDRSPDP